MPAVDFVTSLCYISFMTKNKELSANLILILVAAIWGGGFVSGKLALSGLSPLAILMHRFCICALLFGVLFFKRIKAGLAGGVIKTGCILGLIQFSALLVQLIALQYTTSAKQSFIAASYVIFTPFAAWIMAKVKPRKIEITAAALALFGIGLISLSSGIEHLQIGDPMTLGFSVLFSIQIVVIGSFAKDFDVFALTFWQSACSAVLSVIAVLITQTSVIPADAVAFCASVYISVINTGVAMLLQNYAQRYTKDSHSALLLSLESVFGFIFSILIFGDSITIPMILGCAIVFFAILLSKK